MLFHPILKESVVFSLFTKSTVDKDQHSNYHPVSTLSLLSKIIEYVVTSNQAIASLTRSPAIAEGPRDAGVPVEIW